MKIKSLSLALMLALGLVIGCDEAEDPRPPVGDPGTDAVEPESGEADNTIDAMKERGADAMETAQEKVEDIVAAGKDEIEDMTTDTDTETDPATAAGEATDLTLEDLEAGMSLDAGTMDGILVKVKNLIGEENYDQASQWISQLEGMELPEGYAEKVAGLKGLLEKAQGAGEMLDGIGG